MLGGMGIMDIKDGNGNNASSVHKQLIRIANLDLPSMKIRDCCNVFRIFFHFLFYFVMLNM